MSDVTAPPPARPLRELLPHLIWEAVLLVAAIGLTIALYNRAQPLYESGAIWLSIASLGFATSGLALSLRTGTPNLAVGSLASLAAFLYADQNIGVAVVATVAAGLVLALLVGLTGLPGWAVTLLGALLLQGIVLGLNDGNTYPLPDRPDTTLVWGVGFIVVSIAGGVVFAIPAVRRYLSANRPAGGEAGAFSGARLLGALVGVGGSSLLAALAGIVFTIQIASASPVDTGFTLAALTAAMLAGVSPFGRRAGILGVVLAVVVLDATRRFIQLENGGGWAVYTAEALLGLFGVLVVWILEVIGRRTSPLVTALPARPAPQFAPGGYQPQLYPPPPQFGPPGQVPPVSAPPTYGAPASAPPVSAPPTYGAPASAPPAYGPPASAPPAYGSPASAPPNYGPPVSAPPTSAPPVSAPPTAAPPAGFPPLPGSQPPPPQGPSWPSAPQ